MVGKEEAVSFPYGIATTVTHVYEEDYWEYSVTVMAGGQKGKKMTRKVPMPTHEESKGWKVHVPEGTAGRLKVREMFGKEWEQCRYRTLTSMHERPKIQKGQGQGLKIPKGQGPSIASQFTRTGALGILVDHGVVKKVSHNMLLGAHFTLAPFLLPEWHKCRWRVLAEPKQLNEELRGKCPARLPKIVGCYRAILDCTVVLEIDFVCFYYQLALGRQGSPYLFKGGEGKWYQWLVVPMGATWAVEAAQEVALQFTKLLLAKCHDIAVTELNITYIDNIYIGFPSLAAAEAARNIVLEMAAKFNAKVTTEVTRTPTVLGMTCDLEKKTIVLAKKFYGKHAEAWNASVEVEQEAVRLVRWLGVWIRAAYMLRVPLHAFPKLLKLLSKVARQAAAGEWKEGTTVHLSPEDQVAIAEMRELTKEGTQAKIKKEATKDYELIVYSDAAEWGSGYVAVGNEGITVDSTPWEDCPKDQVTREAQGVSRAIKACCSKRIVLLSDASAVVEGVKKGYSHNPHINLCAQLCDKYDVLIAHIPGVTNIADGVSRGRNPPNPQEVARSIRHVTEDVLTSKHINQRAASTW